MNTGFTQNGYTLSRENHQELINESDLYGETIIDTVYRGGDTFIQFISRVYKAGSLTPWWPWGANIGELWNTVGVTPISRLGSVVASGFSAFVLTAVVATPAAASPATLTAPLAILAPGYNTELLFDSRARNVPIRLLCLPQEPSPMVTMSYTSGQTGHSTDDTTYWLPVVGSLTPSAWSGATSYVPGNIVSSGGNNYICILATLNNVPPNATYWKQVTIANLGTYNVATTYNAGDYVTDSRGYWFTMT